MSLRTALLTGAAFLALTAQAQAEAIRIGVGHQSMCTDTYSAGIIVKELKLLEKHLPRDGKYKDAQYELAWNDYTSGPPITNMMLANKLEFGVMGDYPLIVNGAKFQQTESLRSIYIAGTGYNLKGSGNSVVVPADSDIYSFEQLKGRSVSTPVGSAAWGTLLKALQDHGIKPDEITLKDQSPPVGAANIAQKKIDAHADFCPWSELMEYRGTGRKIYDGSEAGIPYLHGVVVRKDFSEKYPEVVVAFLKAVIEAGRWVEEDPVRAAESLEKWTGIEKEVQYLYFSRGGHLTLDPTIKPKWVEALKYDHGILAKERQIPPLDFTTWINDGFIRQAFKELGLDYDRQAAVLVDPAARKHQLLPELWHPREGLKSFISNAELLKSAAEFAASGQKVNATYVYDEVTGLKLLGKVAFYVQAKDGTVGTFLRKTDAEQAARQRGGTVLAYADALAATAPKP